jgi:hypothetical protein
MTQRALSGAQPNPEEFPYHATSLAWNQLPTDNRTLTALNVGALMLTSFRRHLVLAILATSSIFMSLLIIQQDRTIDSQRTLIQQLFRDSLELNAMKVRLTQQK